MLSLADDDLDGLFEFARSITHLWPCDDDDSPVQPCDANQGARSATPATSALRGWSPPNGSQFIDLDDDSLVLPPWPPTPPASKPECNTGTIRSPEMAPPGPPSPYCPAGLSSPSPPRLPTRDPARSRSALRPQKAAHHAAKQQRSRPALAAAAPSSKTHARPPRGGIPPHVARSVTKANILRAEKENKVIRDASSSTTKADGKKPSVLRGSAAAERENAKTTSDGGGASAKILSDACENAGREGRATKRARV